MTTAETRWSLTEDTDTQRVGQPASVAGGDRRDADDLQRRRDQVVAALDRLARGEFACCEVCGVQIDDRRLRIAPDADRCLQHTATRARTLRATEGGVTR